MTRLQIDRVRALTFDCYGTLVDWRGGLTAALRRAESLSGIDVDRLLADRERVELELEAGPYRPYRDVLAISLARAARQQEREPSPAELSAMVESMATWEPFEETHEALLRLRERFRLAILSNVDTDVLQHAVAKLDVPFDALVTSEEQRAFKPATPHFEEGLVRLELTKGDVLHVAQSLRHDVRTASALGWRTAWVNRLGEKLPMDLKPDLVTRNLSELCDALGC